jgi:hypothetical protein
MTGYSSSIKERTMSVFSQLFRVSKPFSSCQHNSRNSLRAVLIALYVSLICMLDQAQAASHFSVTVQGQGQPILLIPGLMSDQRIWQQTADQLDDRYQLQMSAASDPTTVGQAVYELLTTDLRENVAKIQQPVLLLGAGGALPDASMRPAITALYQQQIAKIPQATLRFHWQSRHFIMLDEPQWLLTEINQFLQP